MLADAGGQVTDQYTYDAFGNSVVDTGSTNNDYRYIGQQLDDETGLYYMRNRYYDSATGRFLSRDPVDGDPTMPHSLHRYLYAGNDPMNFADPNGDYFTLLGLSFSMLGDTGFRGLEVNKNVNVICRLKAFAKVIPLLVGVKQAASSRFGFAEKLFDLLTPSIGLGSLANPSLSPGLSVKQAFYEHPLAKQAPVPHYLAGELKSVEFEIKATSLTAVDLELSAAEFPNTSVKLGPVGCQIFPSFRITSFAAGLGFEKPLYDVRVCGFVSVGTISGVFTGSVGANGFNFSGSSLEAGVKVGITFMPEITFNVFKLPDDMR